MVRAYLRARMRIRAACLIGMLAPALITSGPVHSADLSVREITRLLFRAREDAPVDLTARDLSFLDLSGLNFKAAKLAGANLHGSDLSGANLRSADLSSALLDRATIVGADFSGANLAGAFIRLPYSVGSAQFDKANAPRFRSANLSGARIVARLDGADFRDANLAHANFAPFGDTTQNTVAQRSMLIACDFSGALLRGANLSKAILRFSKFENAILSDSDLSGADLSMTELSGADLTGANIAGAMFDNADLGTVRGMTR